MPHCPGGRSLNDETGGCELLLSCRQFSLGKRRNVENPDLDGDILIIELPAAGNAGRLGR
jgi:hypothetical protein